MSSINVDQLAESMVQAAQGAFGEKWHAARNYAESEFRRIAEALAYIEAQRALKLMCNEKAILHFNMQKNNARVAMYALQGLSVLTVEAAINAALDAVKTTLNTALGLKLI